MGVGDFLRVLGRNWLIILVAVLVPVVVAVAMSSSATPLYSASASSFVSQSAGRNPAALAQGSLFIESQLDSYAQLADKPVVLEAVIDELDLDTTAGALAGSVSARIPSNTSIISVRVVNESAELAADIANAIVEELSTVAVELAPKNDDGTSTVVLTTVEPATAPSVPFSPNTQRNAALAAIAGLALGVGLAFLRSLLDTRVRSVREVRELVSAPVLAEIPESSSLGKGKGVLRDAVGDPVVEEFRRLRASLRFIAIGEHPQVFALVSAAPGEGKSTVIANLALTAARGGSRTLLIDADLRKRQLSEIFGGEPSIGLTGVLTGQYGFDEAAQTIRTPGAQLVVLGAGEVPPNPIELLGSPQMHQLIENLKGDFDLVLVDTPALGPVADAIVTAGWTSGSILVVRPGRVNRRELEGALTALHHAHGNLAGLIVTGVARVRYSDYHQRASVTKRQARKQRKQAKKAGKGAQAAQAVAKPARVKVPS